jgi:hypothetical protein
MISVKRTPGMNSFGVAPIRTLVAPSGMSVTSTEAT